LENLEEWDFGLCSPLLYLKMLQAVFVTLQIMTFKRKYMAAWAGLCKVECIVCEYGKPRAGFQNRQLSFRYVHEVAGFSTGYCSQQELLDAEPF